MSRARTSVKLVAVSAELWSMGETVDGIVATIGIARGTLVDIARRRRDLFPGRKSGRQKGHGFWTEAKIAKAVEIWDAGGRGEDISDRLAVGLSSVRAAIARNRDRFSRRTDLLAQTGMRHPPKVKKPKAEKRAAKPKPAPKAPVAPQPVAKIAPPPAADATPMVVRDRTPKAESFRPLPGIEPLPKESPITIRRCAWPVHLDDDPFTNANRYFCGEPKIFGKPYCDAHDRLAHSSGTPGERSADRVMEFHAGRAA